jgi:hypothetical protein
MPGWRATDVPPVLPLVHAPTSDTLFTPTLLRG